MPSQAPILSPSERGTAMTDLEERHVRDTALREAWPMNDERANYPLANLARAARAAGRRENRSAPVAVDRYARGCGAARRGMRSAA